MLKNAPETKTVKQSLTVKNEQKELTITQLAVFLQLTVQIDHTLCPGIRRIQVKKHPLIQTHNHNSKRAFLF